MSLNYDKTKEKLDEGSHTVWISYSDLATVLTVLFLMLYAVATLRSSAVSVAQQVQLARAQKQIDDLQNQVTTFDVLKQEYLQKGASDGEKKMYNDLLGQMKLLESQAHAEREKLSRQAREEGEKERGLNRYQALIKNIITANMLAQSELKKRDQVIAEKGRSLVELKKLETEKENQIERNNREIAQVEAKLRRSIEQIKAHTRSKRKLQQEIARVRDESEARVATLQQRNTEVASQLVDAKNLISEKEKEVTRKSGEVAQLEAEKNHIMGELRARETAAKERLDALQRDYQANLETQKKNFQVELAQEMLDAEARVNREKAFRSQLEGEKAAHEKKLGDLSKQLEATRHAIQSQEARYNASFAQLATAKGALEKQLAGVHKREEEQKALAARLRKNLGSAGVDADIDKRTGEVTIHFGKEYFDYGSATLTAGMMQILEKAIPAYAESMFNDPQVAKKISSVEIIGFASPTYRGKYVNPKELSQEARRAVDYNMDLSYRRAKSIFDYVFDLRRMHYAHQKDLLALTKVAGLGYLKAAGARDLASSQKLSDEEYCDRYDCTKSQKVIIKFNFSER